MQTESTGIAVFGEALVDDFLTEQVVGGAPFNVARHLAAFGIASLMITRIGSDDNGAMVAAEFKRFGMRTDGLQIDPQAPTGRVIVERSAGNHRFEILPRQAYDLIDVDAALAAMARCTPSVICFGTLAQREATSRGALRALLAATPAMRFLDLNLREGQVTERCVFESLHEADVVKVNEQELSELFRWYTDTQPPTTDMAASEVQLACSRLMQVFGVSGLIVTLGPRGVVYFGADGILHSASAQADTGALVDTVGAGDAFSAIFLLGSTLAWPLATTLQRANDFAASICALAGAVPADIAFYEQWHTRWLAD